MKDKNGKSLEQTLENLETELSALRRINETLNKKCKRLERENWELKRSALPLNLRRKLESTDASTFFYKLYTESMNKQKSN